MEVSIVGGRSFFSHPISLVFVRKNADNPSADDYSILDQLEDFRGEVMTVHQHENA